MRTPREHRAPHTHTHTHLSPSSIVGAASSFPLSLPDALLHPSPPQLLKSPPCRPSVPPDEAHLPSAAHSCAPAGVYLRTPPAALRAHDQQLYTATLLPPGSASVPRGTDTKLNLQRAPSAAVRRTLLAACLIEWPTSCAAVQNTCHRYGDC